MNVGSSGQHDGGTRSAVVASQWAKKVLLPAMGQ